MITMIIRGQLRIIGCQQQTVFKNHQSLLRKHGAVQTRIHDLCSEAKVENMHAQKLYYVRNKVTQFGSL